MVHCTYCFHVFANITCYPPCLPFLAGLCCFTVCDPPCSVVGTVQLASGITCYPPCLPFLAGLCCFTVCDPPCSVVGNVHRASDITCYPPCLPFLAVCDPPCSVVGSVLVALPATHPVYRSWQACVVLQCVNLPVQLLAAC